MNPLIVLAIRSRHVLLLTYASYHIIVEPHVYGLDFHGDPSLLCYRISDATTPGEFAGWRLLNLRDALSIVDTTAPFAGARPGYRRNDMAIRAVFEQL